MYGSVLFAVLPRAELSVYVYICMYRVCVVYICMSLVYRVYSVLIYRVHSLYESMI